MTSVNQNLNLPYNTYPTPQRQEQIALQQVKLPAYYNTANNYTQSDFKEAFKDNLLYSMVLKPFIEHPIATISTWLTMGLAMDAYSTSCGGEYEKSLVKKAANLGDRIQTSKYIQNKPVQAVINGIGTIGNQGKKLASKSAILRATTSTPTMPEWEMVKSQMFNHKQEVVQDFIRITETLKLGTPESAEGHSNLKLKNLGPSKSELEMLKKRFNATSVSQIPQEKAVTELLLKRLGRTPNEIAKIQALGSGAVDAAKAEVLKEMGLTSEQLKLIKEDVYGKYIDDVKTAAGKVKGKVKMGVGHYDWMGKASKPFERTVGCDEVYNKLHSITNGAKTGTGRAISKFMQMVHRGITFGGGKLGALLFIAPALVEVGSNVGKADKDQKVGTAANGFVESISWVFTFPLGLKILHGIGGIKHAGMTKEQVEQVRNIKKEFNDKNGSGFINRLQAFFGGGKEELKECQFKNKAEYKKAKAEAKKQIKELSKVKGQNIFTKGIRKLFGFLTLDLGNLRGYHGGNMGSKFLHDIPHLLKDVVGIPMRFGVWGLISMGVLGAALTKCTTAVFGKSYDEMKEDERKDARKKQKEFLVNDLNSKLFEIQKNKQLGNTVTSNNVANGERTMALRGRDINSDSIPQIQPQEVMKKEKVDNYTYIPSQECTIPYKPKEKTDNYTYIPSSECTIKSDKANEKNRKYIPSQAAANISKTFDNSGLQSALDRAQRAEDKALRVLAGNFDNL